MEANEIIKALQLCTSEDLGCEDDCPYVSIGGCLSEDNENILLKDALGLINSQKAEIERLKAEIRNTDNILNSLDRPLIEVKTEAYREFAERVKDMSEDCPDWGRSYVLCEDIDWLLERFQEGI